MNLKTRAVTDADREYVRATHAAAYYDVTLRQFGVWDEVRQDEYFRAAWERGGLEIVLIDDEPCGYCQIEIKPEQIYGRELVLAPAFQRRGIGTAFLRNLQARARALGCPIRIGTLHENRAFALYQRGFRETGRTEMLILMEWLPNSVPTE